MPKKVKTIDKINRDSCLSLMYTAIVEKVCKDTSVDNEVKYKIIDIITKFAEETETLQHLAVALFAVGAIVNSEE